MELLSAEDAGPDRAKGCKAEMVLNKSLLLSDLAKRWAGLA